MKSQTKKTNGKRYIHLSILIFFLILVSPTKIYGRDFHVPDGVLRKYLGKGGDITLPDDVQKVGASVFYNNKDITSVIIPEGCFEIEDSAFLGCINLRTVSLPSTIRTISTRAFKNCSSLEYIVLPQGLEALGTETFAGCSSLGAATVPKTVTEIGAGCFAQCENLSLLEAESGCRNYKTVGSILFSSDGKTLLQYPAGKRDTHFDIPHGVETISAHAFEESRNLREITFPSTVKEIHPYAFSGCTGLIQLELPDSMVLVKEYSFKNCSNLNKLYVYSRETQTVVRAFDGDTSLVIYVPNDSLIKKHAKKYNIRYRELNDDTYDYPDTEQVF